MLSYCITKVRTPLDARTCSVALLSGFRPFLHLILQQQEKKISLMVRQTMLHELTEAAALRHDRCVQDARSAAKWLSINLRSCQCHLASSAGIQDEAKRHLHERGVNSRLMGSHETRLEPG